MKLPLFILGSPRSGTSLLRLIMTSHSQIVIPPECGFIIWLHKKHGNWQASNNNDSSKLASFLDDLFESKKFDTWLLDRALIEKKILDCQPGTYPELCEVVYATFAQSIGKEFSVWGDKNNFYLSHLDKLLTLYKKACFLHIIRDGRDVACSYREVMEANSGSPYAPKLDVKINNIAMEWSNNVMKIDSFLSALSDDSVMTIRYEDLTSDPTAIVMKICKWLGLKFEDDMLNFYELNKSNKLEPDLTIDWKKRTLLPISNTTVRRYTTHLSSEEKDTFQIVAKAALRRFSYF